MLKLTIPKIEMYDEAKGEFFSYDEETIQLEHSLVSISKWESIWHKPFLTKEPKTSDETLSYIKCMTITQNVKDSTFEHIMYSNKSITQIKNYIDDTMTATTVKQEKGGSREIITSELIYYWMIALNIPMECQRWHLNRLLTLVKVCNVKNTPPKKMGRRELASRNASLNAARRKKLNTRG